MENNRQDTDSVCQYVRDIIKRYPEMEDVITKDCDVNEVNE